MKILISVLVAFACMDSFASVTKSAYTDLTSDCVVISSATKKAAMDFSRAECKSFGGYSFEVEGVDLRYGPVLTYNGKTIDLKRPETMHSITSTQVEWVYDLDQDDMGVGKHKWKGMVYGLQMGESQFGPASYYAVRLDGDKSCLLGIANTSEEARSIINTKSDCLK